MDDIQYVKFSTAPLPAEPYHRAMYDWIHVSQESCDELCKFNHADRWSNEDGDFVLFRTVAPEQEAVNEINPYDIYKEIYPEDD